MNLTTSSSGIIRERESNNAVKVEDRKKTQSQKDDRSDLSKRGHLKMLGGGGRRHNTLVWLVEQLRTPILEHQNPSDPPLFPFSPLFLLNPSRTPTLQPGSSNAQNLNIHHQPNSIALSPKNKILLASFSSFSLGLPSGSSTPFLRPPSCRYRLHQWFSSQT